MRIEDYALIGDCETAALVSREGTLDWLCWPRFDSDACFAALLGDADNGHWTLRPSGAIQHTERSYRPDTLILETVFTTATGRVRLIDFMPPRTSTSDVVRVVVGESGCVPMRTELSLRFDYGASVPWVTRVAPRAWSAIAGPHRVVLHTSVDVHGENLRSVANFEVRAGETARFALTYSASHLPLPDEYDVDGALIQTEAFWREWVQRCTYQGPYRDIVQRSLMTLRALIYAPTGGIVAAPTTSLPEAIGGERNWDYRFCWLRDATLTLLALMNAGYTGEAAAWRDWLVRAVAGSPSQMQIMYGVAGERRLMEWEAAWLSGYEGSRPVRIGNAAHAQLQIDVYGEVMDALYQARKGGLERDDTAWALQLELLKHLESVWTQPDYGIWEIRGQPRHFTYSKVMAWVAFDRAIKTVERLGLPGPVDCWRTIRSRIHDEVCSRGFDRSRNTFVQSYGSAALDASLLLLPAVGFLDAHDPRILGTVAAVERNLLRDGFVLRYDTHASDDGLPPGEGAFLPCSFWLADAYVMCGRTADAEALFARLVGLVNDVGLLAEEYDARSKRQLGNFPQAFTHVTLVGTACNLMRYDKPVEQRSEHAAPGSGTEAPVAH